MTKQDLSRHLTLLRRLEKHRALLASLEAASLGDETAGIRDEMASLEAEVQRSEAAVTAYSATIEDLEVRMIFRLRFLHGFEWNTVASLIGGKNTGKSVNNYYRRYMEAHHVE